jgi:hypothetical protein
MFSQNAVGETGLPRLLNEHPESTQDAMRRLLKFVGQWREYLFRRWLYSKGNRKDDTLVSSSVDDLIFLALLFAFIKQRNASAVPELKEIVGGLKQPSVWSITRYVRKTTLSPVLKSLFDLKMTHNRCLIPKAVIESSWHNRCWFGIWDLFDICSPRFCSGVVVSYAECSMV